VERLGRSGIKTTTLDFESEKGYRAHARDFARRRGIDTLAGIAAGMEGNAARRLTWIAQKHGQVANLWERASVALGFTIEGERQISYNEQRTEPLSAEVSSAGKYLIAPTIAFARSVDEDARRT
ncbi:MAG: Ti-type conjugative transfer relaxase TraA, partial [Mesorhizobium sp.]